MKNAVYFVLLVALSSMSSKCMEEDGFGARRSFPGSSLFATGARKVKNIFCKNAEGNSTAGEEDDASVVDTQHPSRVFDLFLEGPPLAERQSISDFSDTTARHPWAFILNHFQSDPLLDDSTKAKVYKRNTFRRAVSLLSEYYLPSEHETLNDVPRFVLNELKILDMLVSGLKETGMSGGDAFLYQALCSLKKLNEIEQMQQNIRVLQDTGHNETIGLLLSKLSDREGYLLASVAQESLSFADPTSVLGILDYYFKGVSDAEFGFILRSPLAHFYIDLMERNISQAAEYKTQDVALSGFWENHVLMLTAFLRDVSDLGIYINAVVRDAGGEEYSFLREDAALFLSPEIVELRNLLDAAQEEMIATNTSTFFSILLEYRPYLLKLYGALSRVDALYALAQLTKHGGYCFTSFNEQENGAPSISVSQGWCPFLSDQVPFSCKLGGSGQKTIIVTGACSAGKSVFLKSIGIATLLSLALGIAPAQAIEMSAFEGILTSFNVHDSIADGLSSFQAQMKRLGEIQNVSTQDKESRYLILLDEPLNSAERWIVERATTVFIKTCNDVSRLITILATHCEQPPALAASNPEDYAHYVVEENHELKTSILESHAKRD